ncbi:hypothetical protein B296_00028358, partial [Ensete ventricosum]
VFDLGEEAPDKVLHRLYANFEKLKSDGDGLAEHIERTLRLIGKKNPGTNRQSVKYFLNQVKKAKEMQIDRKVITLFVVVFGTTSVWV